MRRGRTALIGLLLVALLPLGGCAARTRPTLIRIDSAVYQTTRGIFEAAVILGDNKIITPQQELAIQQAILPVAQLGETATAAIAAWVEGPTPQALRDLVTALGNLSQTVVRTFGSNDAAKATLLEKIVLAQQAVLTIISIMGGTR